MLATQNHWYVQVSDQAYGPYSIEQMRHFIDEGRVISSSLISQDMVQGFAMAAAFPAFAPLLAHAPASTQASYVATKTSVTSQPLQQTKQQSPSESIQQQALDTQRPVKKEAVSVFLVMAEIRSRNAMQFLQALQAYGTAQRIGDTVWLLRSDIPLEAIHGALSASLDKSDRLFILDSFANKTAWSNIGADMDKRIREMWNV